MHTQPANLQDGREWVSAVSDAIDVDSDAGSYTSLKSDARGQKLARPLYIRVTY